MNISSPVFANNQPIPQKYSCQGEGIRPSLQISDVPEETKSLVLIVDDPDAPIGLFTHWVLYNITPNISEIAENALPQGAMEGKNSTGQTSWVAPCPPKATGIHRYQFHLYALSKNLDVEKGVSREVVETVMKDCILQQAELVGVFGES